MESFDQFIDSTSALRTECPISAFSCRSEGCGKQCKSNDEGVNPFMKICNACDIMLRVSLEKQLEEIPAGENEALPDEPEGDVEDPPPLELEGDAEDPPPLEPEGDVDDPPRPEPNDEPEDLSVPELGEKNAGPGDAMTIEDISTSLRLLVQASDKRLTADIRLGKFNNCCFKIKTAVIKIILLRDDVDSIYVYS